MTVAAGVMVETFAAAVAVMVDILVWVGAVLCMKIRFSNAQSRPYSG